MSTTYSKSSLETSYVAYVKSFEYHFSISCITHYIDEYHYWKVGGNNIHDGGLVADCKISTMR